MLGTKAYVALEIAWEKAQDENSPSQEANSLATKGTK